MEDRALGNSSTAATNSQQSSGGTRNVWILTAYGISGLALFGILLYYFSTYIAH